MTDLASTIDSYLSAWTEQDPSRREKLIEDVWADDGRLARITGFFGGLPAS